MVILIWVALILAMALLFTIVKLAILHRRLRMLRWMVKKLEGSPVRHPYDSSRKAHTGDSEGNG